MSWPAKPGWLESQYCAALTMRRRARVGSAQPGVVDGSAALNLDECETPAFQRHEVDLADRCDGPSPAA
jgi:hypothetical protein